MQRSDSIGCTRTLRSGYDLCRCVEPRAGLGNDADQIILKGCKGVLEGPQQVFRHGGVQAGPLLALDQLLLPRDDLTRLNDMALGPRKPAASYVFRSHARLMVTTLRF